MSQDTFYSLNPSTGASSPSDLQSNGTSSGPNPNVKSAGPNCVMNIALKLTSIYETSSQELQWGVCVTLDDNHGYSAGIVQFTTGTGSAQQVINEYTKSVGSQNEFTRYQTQLQQLATNAASSGSVDGTISGLEGFCDAWKQASVKKEFQNAQLAIMKNMYYDPSQQIAQNLGLRTALAKSQIFDCTIQLGGQGTLDIASSVGSVGGNEKTWLQKFLDARSEKLQSIGGAYAPTVTRVNSYQHIFDTGNLNFAGDCVEALNNDGEIVQVQCDPDVIASDGNTTTNDGGGTGGDGNFSHACKNSVLWDMFWFLIVLGLMIEELK
ncbi:hypothetical protein HDU76_000977 [Blyttiomyces sp. JEL0837]|nr:hypothetical protein HDU76_000977 [Blyttiomyces sp. JEL0837]